MKFPVIFFLVPLLFCQISAGAAGPDEDWAQVEDASAVVAAFNEASGAVKSINCDFTQEKYMDVLVSKDVSKGHYSYTAPETVRIEYVSPEVYSIDVNGHTVSFTSGGVTQQTDLSSNRRWLTMMDLFRRGGIPSDGNMSKYNIKAYESATCYKLEISSKKSRTGDAEVIIDKSDMSLNSFKMYENGGDYTEFFFYNKKID